MRRYFSKEDFISFLNFLECGKVTPLRTESVEDGSTDTYYFMKEVFLKEEIILYQIYSGGIGIIQDTPVAPWEDYAEGVWEDLVREDEFKVFIEVDQLWQKKAFLVTFEITTRVVTDVPEEFNPSNCNLIKKEDRLAFNTIIKQARDNILEVPENYIYAGNAEIAEDIECPYDSNTEE